MPEIVTQHYALTGWAAVTLYSEQEMADALGLTRSELRAQIERGIGLAFHGNPRNTHNRQYTFLPDIYEQNIRVWECVQSGGHYYEQIDTDPLTLRCSLCGRRAYP